MKTMTPLQTTTVGQINKAVANYRALLEKHAEEFESNLFQAVLGQPELASEQFNTLRTRVEAISGMIVRTVKVNRNQSPQQMLDATGRKQYTNKSVVAGIPKGKGAKKQVYFFKVSRYITEEELEKEYKLRGLEPDVYAQAKANQDDPAFADTHPNCTHWKDENGNWNFSAFYRLSGERRVFVDCNNFEWRDYWWFGGVRE